MKFIILSLTVLGCALAVPNGYYHQEYNYKSSSKAYKNNELQHSTDDQGYYRKDGDLEGREKPIVDANSEHSEYVNPNARNGQYSNGYGDSLSSHGVMNAQQGYGANQYSTNDLRADNMASSDHIAGSRAYSDDYASGQYGASYGTKSYGASSSYGSGSYGSANYGNSYASSSNIRSVVENLRRELENDVQAQIQQHNAYSSSRIDLSQLEQDVRKTLNEKLRNELSSRYGHQTIRNGMSYTIENGQVQPTANYNEQEYQNLRTDLENSLLSQLRNGYNQRYDSHYEESHRYNYGYTSTVRPTSYRTMYPSLPYYSTTPRTTQYAHYAPVSNPESVTNIATRIQSNLDTSLNQLLNDVYAQHFSTRQQYLLTNTDVVLRRLEHELKSNISSLIDVEIRKNYGSQIEKDGYWYSTGPQGQISNNYNYAARDIDALKAQVERNLIRKLTETFETYKAKWSQSSSNVIYGNNYDTYSTTPRYYYSTTPNYYHSTPVISSVKGGSSSSNYYYSGSSGYTGASGSSGSSGYTGSSDYGSSSSSSRYDQFQRQLQNDLSRQLQDALHRSYNQYSNSGSSNTQAYQNSLQDLTDELNRNLTRKFQEYSASGSYSSYGHFDRAEMDRLQNQLQNNLMSELQRNLQNQYSSSSSYSASSSSSSSSGSAGHYRPIRGSQNNQLGQYRSGSTLMAGEDCNEDDPNSYRNYRMKRSYGTYGRQNHQTQPERLEDFHDQQEIGQEIDDSDLTQQIEHEEFGNLQSQTQFQRKPVQVGQQIDVSDTYHVGQGVDNSYRYSNYGKPNTGNQFNHQVGQEIDDTDLTQQTEDLNPSHRVVPSNGNYNRKPEMSSTSNYGSNINSQENIVRSELKNKIEQELSQELIEIKRKFKELQQSSHTLSQEYLEEVKNNLRQNISQKLQEIDLHNKRYGTTYYKIPFDDNTYISTLTDEIQRDLLQDFQQERNYNSYQSWHSSGGYSQSSVSQSQNRRTYFQSSQNVPTPSSSFSYSRTTTESIPRPGELEHSNYGKLNTRQMRFVQYVKDKLNLDLKEAIETQYLINKDTASLKETLINGLQKNITNAFDSYSEYFLNEYMDLNAQEIAVIKKQLLVDCTLQLNSELNSHIQQTQHVDENKYLPQNHQLPNPQNPKIYPDQQPKRVFNEFGQTVNEDNTQVSENAFGSSSRIPSGNQNLNSQIPYGVPDQQPKRIVDDTEFVGQTIDYEDEDSQKIENPSSGIPTANQELKPQPPKVYSNHGLQQGPKKVFDHDEFVGQTIDEEDDTKVSVNTFGSSSRIPSGNQNLNSQIPKVYSGYGVSDQQPKRVVDDNGFVGQTIDYEDEDSQKIENPFGSLSGIPSANQEVKPQRPKIYSEHGFQQEPKRVFDHDELVGQTIDEDNTQVSENAFGSSSRIPSGNQNLNSQIPKVYSGYGVPDQQPKRVVDTEFVGQTIDEDEDIQKIENSFGSSSRIPSANQELKPQPPKVYSDHGLQQGPKQVFDSNKFVGQTVDEENTQVSENAFGSSSRIPSGNQNFNSQIPKVYSGYGVPDQQSKKVIDDDEFVGQTIVEDEDTQKIENPFGSLSGIPSANQEVKPQPPKIYSEHGLQQGPQKVFDNDEFVGQTVDEDDNTQVSENAFGSSRIPSENQNLNSQLPKAEYRVPDQQPKRVVDDNGFVGQTIDYEDEDSQKIENPSSGIPTANQELKPQPPKVYSNHGLQQGPKKVFDNNEFVGQTIDEEENTQVSENAFGSSSRIPSGNQNLNSQIPKVYSGYGVPDQPKRVVDDNEFVGQTIDEDQDTQKIENPFGSLSGIPSANQEVKPQRPKIYSEHGFQQEPKRVFDHDEFVGQTIDEDNTQVSENAFGSSSRIPSANQDSKIPSENLDTDVQLQIQQKPVTGTSVDGERFDASYQNRQEAENHADSLIEALRRAQNKNQTQNYGSYRQGSGYSNPSQYNRQYVGTNSYTPYNIRITEQNSYSHRSGGSGYPGNTLPHNSEQESYSFGTNNAGQTGKSSYAPHNSRVVVQETYSYGTNNPEHTESDSYSPYNLHVNEQYSYGGSPATDLQGRTRNSYNSYNGQNSYSHSSSNVDNQPLSGNTYSYKLNYGTQENLDENLESISNIEPLQTQKAYITHQTSNSYAGVKGHGRRLIQNQETVSDPQSISDSPKSFPPSEEPGIEESNREETTPVSVPEDLPWWKRFGNKVSQGAKSIKEKIVG